MKVPRLTLAARVAFLYIIGLGLWILLSDRLAAALFPDPDQLTIARTYKDWLFVVLSALILLIYLARENHLRKTSERDLDAIFDNSVEGLFFAGMDGTWTRVNPALARMLGFASPQEMLARLPGKAWMQSP